MCPYLKSINFIKIYPDDNSLLKKFANLDNEILIENTNEQYQKYLTAPKEKKFITTGKYYENTINSFNYNACFMYNSHSSLWIFYFIKTSGFWNMYLQCNIF